MCLCRQRDDVQGGLETPGHLLPRPLMEQHPQVTQMYDIMGHCSTLAARAGVGAWWREGSGVRGLGQEQDWDVGGLSCRGSCTLHEDMEGR